MIPVLFNDTYDPTVLMEHGGEPLEDTNGELLMSREVGASRTFSSHGIGDLTDAISCFVEEERNGSYELEMEYPIDGLHFEEIANRLIIVAKPNFTDSPQPFRIYKITKPIDGICTIYARHISYDMSGIAVAPFTASTITTALSGLKSHALNDCPFTLSSSRSTAAGFAVDQTSSMRSWLGGKRGSLLDVYGGEWHFDRYTATLENSRGADRGVVINYGRNLTDLEQEEDTSGSYTGCVAIYIDNDTGEETRGEIQYVTGRAYDRVFVLDASGDYDEAPSVATLNSRAAAYLSNNDLSAPSVNITLDFVQSDKLPDRVDLCDTVTIYFEALGVSATAKCIRTKWNVLLDRYEETEFGDAQTNLAETIYEAQKDVENVPTLSEVEQAVNRVTNRITGNLGGYVVMNDSDADGYPDEILVMNEPSTEEASRVWRWNQSGLGYSSEGYAGPYGLAMTIDGEIVADYITAGQLDAAVIKTGILQDRAGRNYWNLITGEISIQSGSENVGNYKTYYAESASSTAPQWDITGELYATSDGVLYDRNGAQLMAQPVYTQTVPINTDPTYKWMRTLVEYTDGTTTVTSAAPLFDDYGRSQLVIKTITDANGKKKGYLSALADYMELTSGQLRIFSPQFTLDEEGNAIFSGTLNAAAGSFAGELRAATGSFEGAVTATSLTLASGVSVAASKVSGLATVATSGRYSDLSGTPDMSIYVYKNGTIGSNPASGATGFKVSSSGLLQASNAVIWGTIYATAGTIGGLTLSSNSIKSSNGNFSVSSAGAVSASNITVTGGSITLGDNFKVTSSGAMTAASGTIGPWHLSNSSIWYGSSTYGSSSGMYFGTSGLSLGSKFKVTAAGAMTCTDANISGEITLGGSSDALGKIQMQDSSGNQIGFWNSSGLQVRDSILQTVSTLVGTLRGLSCIEQNSSGTTKDYSSYTQSSAVVINRDSAGSTSLYRQELSRNYIAAARYINGTASSRSYMTADALYTDGNLWAAGAYTATSSAAANVCIGSNGYFSRSTSSSRRYKTDITEDLGELDPEKLYDLKVVRFRFRDGYIAEGDERAGKDVIGFIAEDVDELYPIAVRHEGGQAEMWESNYIIPAMLKLIQKQKKEIDQLKEAIYG